MYETSIGARGMKKKRSFSIKRNKTRKSTNIVPIVIASIIAAVGTAVFGILKWKGKENVDDEPDKTVEPDDVSKDSEDSVILTESSASGESDARTAQITARLAHRKIDPGELDWEQLAKEKEAEQIRRGNIPEDMLKDVKKPKLARGLKRRNWKIALSGIAMLLTVAVVAVNITQYLRPAEAIAKESFAGIGKIVADHEETPYKILDIVPSEVLIPATHVGGPQDLVFHFSTGTMGYMAGGKAPFADDLVRTFTDNEERFLTYENRNKLFDIVVSSGNSMITYEEAYGWTRDNLKSGDWTLIFEGGKEVSVDSNNQYILKGLTDGIFKGTWKKQEGGDFELIDGLLTTAQSFNLDGAVYGVDYNEYGALYYPVSVDQLADKEPDFLLYKAEVINTINSAEGSAGYPAEYPVYRYNADSGQYMYAGTIGDHFGNWNGDNGNSGGSNSGDGDDGDGNDDGNETPEGGEDGNTDNNEGGEGEEGGNTDGNEEGETTDGNEEGETTGGGDESTDGTDGDGSTDDNSSVEPLNISRNTVFINEWRRLVEADGESDEEASEADKTEEGSDNSQNADIPESGTDDTLTDGEPNEDSENPQPDDSSTSEPENSSESAESNETFYILDFICIGTAASVEAGMIEDYALGAVTLGEDVDTLADDGTDNSAGRFIYVGPEKGNYTLKYDADGETYQVYNAPVYIRCRGGNDYLRKYVFNSLSGGDNANSSFKIEVTTVRADEVTADMVYGTDLVYLESGATSFIGASDGSNVSYIGSGDEDSTSDEGSDMNESAIRAILSRATDDLMPIIVDYDITEDEDHYNGTNYQFLAKALLKRDLAGFFEAVDGSDLTSNIKMGIEDDDYPDKDDNKYHYVNQNVYVTTGMLYSNDDEFYKYLDSFEAKSGFNEVLAAISAENTMLAEEDRISLKVSKARAIQYIINYSVGIMGEFEDLTILELQPTANVDSATGAVYSDLHTEVDSKENMKLYWKTGSMQTGKQILYSKKPFSVTTDVKSVAEFNGEWEDINGAYDMIFIGLDGMNLNLDNNKPGRSIYNNNNLNGKVYHSGDTSGLGTYDSNDITSQKMMGLLEYLQAGYPIVVENDCFKDGTALDVSEDSINTEYIADDTLMYRFLSAAVSDERYSESLFTVSDTMSSALFMARMKTSKPRIELLNEDGSEVSQESDGPAAAVVQRLVLDENDEYHGRIAYAVKNNRGEDYLGSTEMRLYADMNYDGIFGVEEELTGYVNEGNVIDVAITGMGPGIIPWKLEVADTGNACRRDSVQGYFELLSTNEQEVRVLQVTAKRQNPFVDLKQMYNIKEDSMLAYYLRGAEGNANISFEFESVTPDMLNENLAKNAKYLNQWDIVVLTVDDTVTVNNPAIVDYINEGRSLLVCNQNKNLDKEGFASELFGWYNEDIRRTYVSLGTGESNLHRYADLKAEMYEAQHGNLKAEKINEGSILYYPYQLGGSSFALGNTESGLRASEYLLNFENNLKSEATEAYVTAWVTLGGTTSTAYGISPRDARNNYYCYSKGNVVYLAQSEYQYTYDAANNGVPDGNEGSEECKFFVNALMAAYSAGVHGSSVSMVSGFAQTSAPVKSISVPFDQEWRETADDGTKGILDETVDVYFKFADSNVGANKKVTVSFYYEDPAGTQEFAVGDTTVKATPFGSDIWTVTDNKLVQVTPNDAQNPDQVGLVPGKVYQIKAPVVPLRMLTDDTVNDAGIYVLVESEFTRTGKVYKIDGFGTVSLNRTKLFLLE